MTPQAAQATESFTELQDEICAGLEALDGAGVFGEDEWERPGGGGGRSRTLTGAVVEKGGVGFSAVHGALSPLAAQALKMEGQEFYATGVSIVLHPRNPHTPIIHMNVRYFELGGGRWWFGGGIDLTPHYIDRGLAGDFHRRLAATCAAHPGCGDYDAFKRQADEYFYLPHRKETRGVGGIFYDRLHVAGFDALLAFSLAVGRTFVPAYAAQVGATHALPYSDEQRRWQGLRRGRYVEFNLAWDRGTKFGLETDGRTESILMSMPPQANWVYDYRPADGSPEAATLALLKKDVDWRGRASAVAPETTSRGG